MEGHIVVALEVQVEPVVLRAAVETGVRNVLVVGLVDVALWVGRQPVGMADRQETREILAAIDTLWVALMLVPVLHTKASWAKEDC
jgi:hypothetical protein